jgi:hypothetical protein
MIVLVLRKVASVMPLLGLVLRLSSSVRHLKEKNMVRQISEDDWKIWKKVSLIAYERFCKITLEQLTKIAISEGDHFDTYEKVHDFLRTADRKIENAFREFRRSSALQQLAYAVGEGMISREELAEFSDEAQQIVHLWLQE